MFNDPLSVDECRDLVRRLTECSFPFQCAHGRPSMVPLVNLGNDSRLQLGPDDGWLGDKIACPKGLGAWVRENRPL
jgi:DNA mismatch repair protein MLH3